MSTADGTPDEAAGGRPADAPLTEADIQHMLAALGDVAETAEPGPSPEGAPAGAPEGAPAGAPAQGRAHGTPAKIALVLTPVASAPALAGLCAMSGIDVDVVPSPSGAIAVLELAAKEAPADEWDMSELVGENGGASLPPEAEELALALSRLARAGVVLLSADLATDVGIESGLSGQVHARQYTGGEAGDDVPAGLVLAGADQVVEDLILGRVRPDAVRGHLRSGTLPRWKATRMFTRGLKRRKP
ncbi:hypothetical protein [Georgenia sp. SYP-B2076]|uniref:hypothetical protein n=1 Tax=Georgenia sp. SYP-B2076 TaxID=2495881 RepID=UPI000F8D9F5E|nr:hypothetical protein [Georgenia sp. SYP-B2076]